MALSRRTECPKKESNDDVFSICARGYENSFDDGYRIRSGVIPILKYPTGYNSDLFKNVLASRLAAFSVDDDHVAVFLRGLKDMTPGEVDMNYAWVFGSSMKLTTCSHGDEYVKLVLNSAEPGNVIAKLDIADRTEAAFYNFVETATLNVGLTEVLFPHFLFIFLQHFTLMFFGVTMEDKKDVPQARTTANVNLWAKIAEAYVACVNHVRTRLGERHAELHILCFELRTEVTLRIHANKHRIFGQFEWATRFKSFGEAVIEGMNMGKYILLNSGSLYNQVAPGIMEMAAFTSKLHAKNEELESQLKTMTRELAALKTSQEGAAALGRTEKRAKRDRMLQG